MPRRVKVTQTVFARGVGHLADTINAIYDDHGIPPADLLRGLLEQACQFKRTHGWFSLPVVILPEKFHLNQPSSELKPPANLKPGSLSKWFVGMAGPEDYFLEAVAEAPSPYGAIPPSSSERAVIGSAAKAAKERAESQNPTLPNPPKSPKPAKAKHGKK